MPRQKGACFWCTIQQQVRGSDVPAGVQVHCQQFPLKCGLIFAVHMHLEILVILDLDKKEKYVVFLCVFVFYNLIIASVFITSQTSLFGLQ